MDFDRGLGELSRHRPAQAVRFLQKALAACPPSRAADLYSIGFYLGVGLKRLGYSQSAIRSWLSCRRLHKRGHIARILARITNGYGMEKMACEELDDWAAFASVHLSRYLSSKNRHGFATEAERDMVTDLIRDHWQVLGGSGAMAGKDCTQKLELFRDMQIVFPTVLAGEPLAGPGLIPVDFRAQRRIRPSDRCPCGSGLPHISCCGRVPGREELRSGGF
jgi:hypothetical protein